MSKITLETINQKIQEYYNDEDAGIRIGEDAFCEHCEDLGFDIEVDKGGITYCYSCCGYELPLTEGDKKFLEELLIEKEIEYLEDKLKYLRSL